MSEINPDQSFDKTLERVLDPEGVYWIYGTGDDEWDPSADHLVQLRIDVPPSHVDVAVMQMEADGWNLNDSPDTPDDPQQRLFFRRRQNLLPESKTRMLTTALKVVYPIEGARLWTWITVDDKNDG
ncbi:MULTISPECIES: hypothetical protein [unclassified Sphingomonas]|uniref:hypothetical protein n=1 Tax=unclassified Sphingomonas TaxID=196159 RepID=UPI002151435D|nr:MULTISPECIES: hypothetical protein [unclassified Sphingomonas]MCR5871331.1 hypothetical protein [Sphingomonas sp. J344]UUY00365.1 hypothetical protein LRS08_04455 [Sphingomonas sp. J315]